jgi:hypothetical protein
VQVRERASGTPWDPPPRQTDDDTSGCELFASLLGGAGTAFGPGAKVAAAAIPLLCKASSQSKSSERNAGLPDLQVRLSAGSYVPYATDVARDVDRASFAEQPFVVPIGAIPADGLRLEVYDDDGTEGSELIGAVRLYRDELIAAANQQRIRRSDSLATFELVVERYAGLTPQDVEMPASEGTKKAPTPTVDAGEVIRVTATGDYTVGSFHSQHIGPGGYPGGELRSYNFKYEPLKSAPHASAFFLVGEKRLSAQLVTPCGIAIAPNGGTVVVGVNDEEPGNNGGALSYKIERRAPTAAEWLLHRVADACPTTTP